MDIRNKTLFCIYSSLPVVESRLTQNLQQMMVNQRYFGKVSLPLRKFYGDFSAKSLK